MPASGLQAWGMSWHAKIAVFNKATTCATLRPKSKLVTLVGGFSPSEKYQSVGGYYSQYMDK